MPSFRDLEGRATELGRFLGRGGEGAVYAVPDRPDVVAKIYSKLPDGPTTRKLVAMVRLGTPDLTRLAAWPMSLLIDERSSGVSGFLMPRIEGHREVHALYDPTDRQSAFPGATWVVLLRAARNTAAAFDTVHQHGHVIGDVNQGNLIVSRKATVRLIDCDSFQITHEGHTYPCRVGVPLFTPPELHGRRLDSVVRTPDHDRFGLAVLVFQLLFMGRHPFAGRHPGRALGVETAIREGLFAFGCGAARHGWTPPPFSLRLGDVPMSLAELFERAFSPAASNGEPRPPASEWVTTLEALESRAVACRDDSRHVFCGGNGSCPWCRIEKEGGPSFFTTAESASSEVFDLDEAWRAIEHVRPPKKVEPIPEPPLPARALRQRLPGLVRPLVGLGGSVGIVWYAYWLGDPIVGLVSLWGLAMLLRSGRRARRRRRREQAASACRDDLCRLSRIWEDEHCRDTRFEQELGELRKTRSRLEDFLAQEQREWAALPRRLRQQHAEEQLEGLPLRPGQVPGLGESELRTLRLHLISKVSHISPDSLAAIPGLRLDLVKRLLTLRGTMTRSLVLDGSAKIPAKIQDDLAKLQAKRRAPLEKQLQQGPVALVKARHETIALRVSLRREIVGLQEELQYLEKKQ